MSLMISTLLTTLEAIGARAHADFEAGEIVIEPAVLVSRDMAELIEANYDDVLVALSAATDLGVHARRHAFRGRVGSNRLVPNAPYAPGRCWSCGCESRPLRRRPTRCWRCRIAWSLALEDRQAIDRADS